MVRFAEAKYGCDSFNVSECRYFSSDSFGGNGGRSLDRVVAVNMKGAFLAVKACLPVMKHQINGNVVLTSSITGPKVGCPMLAHYSATKAAIEGFIRTAAIELAKYNITINAVEPGEIFTQKMK